MNIGRARQGVESSKPYQNNFGTVLAFQKLVLKSILPCEDIVTAGIAQRNLPGGWQISTSAIAIME